jgi:hypothetical protein
MVDSMRPRYWNLRVAGGMLGQLVLIVAILAALQFAPQENLPCRAPSGDTYSTPVPAVGGVALGVWLLAALLSFLLIRGFWKRLFIAPPAVPSRNYPARVGLGCVISLLGLATICAVIVAWLAFAHPPVAGCLTF